MCAQLLSCVGLFVIPWAVACRLPVHEIFQARTLEWVAISLYRGSSPPRDRTPLSCVSCIGGFFITEPLGKFIERLKMWLKVMQLENGKLGSEARKLGLRVSTLDMN